MHSAVGEMPVSQEATQEIKAHISNVTEYSCSLTVMGHPQPLYDVYTTYCVMRICNAGIIGKSLARMGLARCEHMSQRDIESVYHYLDAPHSMG